MAPDSDILDFLFLGVPCSYLRLFRKLVEDPFEKDGLTLLVGPLPI